MNHCSHLLNTLEWWYNLLNIQCMTPACWSWGGSQTAVDGSNSLCKGEFVGHDQSENGLHCLATEDKCFLKTHCGHGQWVNETKSFVSLCLWKFSMPVCDIRLIGKPIKVKKKPSRCFGAHIPRNGLVINIITIIMIIIIIIIISSSSSSSSSSSMLSKTIKLQSFLRYLAYKFNVISKGQ